MGATGEISALHGRPARHDVDRLARLFNQPDQISVLAPNPPALERTQRSGFRFWLQSITIPPTKRF
jgi:hypothetical protein